MHLEEQSQKSWNTIKLALTREAQEKENQEFITVIGLKNHHLTAPQIKAHINASQRSRRRQRKDDMTDREQQEQENCLGHETRGLAMIPAEICTLIWGDQIQDFWSNRRVFVRRREDERMVSQVWFLPWGMEEEVWWCFELLVIYSKSGHTEAAWTPQRWHAVLSGLHFRGPLFVFQQDNDPNHTSRLCGAIWLRRSIGRPGLHLNPAEMKFPEDMGVKALNCL